MADTKQIITNITGAGITTAAPTNGAAFKMEGYDINRTFQATVAGTGAVTATVVFQVSNDQVGWLDDASSTVTLSGTTTASGGFTSNAAWAYVRARVTAISGTGATVTCTVGG